MLLLFFLIYSFAIVTLGLSSSTFESGYIVQFDSLLLAKRSGIDPINTFYEQLKADNVTVVPKYNFSSTALNGVSFKLTSGVPERYCTPEKYFMSLSFVRHMWPIEHIKHSKSVSRKKAKRSKFRRQSKTSTSTAATASSTPWNAVHEVTNVNDVHAKGIQGANVVIAIIDTGIDYDHSALGEGFGSSFKVKGGYDFVGDNPTFVNGFSADSDPMDTEGHGTEAAGVATGNSPKYLGVAPQASLLGYRVFASLSSYVTTDVILAAMERAYNDGADIISMSLGSASGFSTNPINVMTDGLIKKGIICVLAAGNNGAYGPYYPFSPAGLNTLAVGSVESTDVVTWPVYAQSSSGESKQFNYLPTNGTYFPLSGDYEVDYSSISACDITSRPGHSSILLISRGTCSDTVQFANIDSLGYTYVLLINGQTNTMLYNYTPQFTGSLRGGAFVDNNFSSWFETQTQSSNNITVTFSENSSPIPFTSSFAGSGYPNRITNWGPTYDNYFYPSISAPGGNILAPTLDDTYVTVSGTSFATPYISGVAALYLSSRGISRSLGNSYSGIALEFNRRLITTAKVLELYDGSAHISGVAAPLNQQGAGLVDALKVIEYSTILTSKPLISLNDTSHRQYLHKITIKNTSNKLLYYKARHVAGTTVTAIDSSGSPNVYFPPYNTRSKAGVIIVPSVWFLPPGGSTIILVTFSLPRKTNEGIVYQGKIEIGINNGEVISVPYMGVQQTTSNIAPISGAPEVQRLTETGLSTVTGPAQFAVGQYDYPFLYINMVFGSKQVSVDLVSNSYTLSNDFVTSPIAGKRNYIGPVCSYDGDTGPLTFPQTYFPRFSSPQLTFPITNFANLSEIPAGKYKILTRALKPFGKENRIKDWERFLSDEITIT